MAVSYAVCFHPAPENDEVVIFDVETGDTLYAEAYTYPDEHDVALARLAELQNNPAEARRLIAGN